MTQGTTIYLNPLATSSLSLECYRAFNPTDKSTTPIQTSDIATPLGTIDGNLLPPEASRPTGSQSPLIAQLSAGTGMAQLFADRPKPAIRMHPAGEEGTGTPGNISAGLGSQLDAQIHELDVLMGGGCEQAIIKHLNWVLKDSLEFMDPAIAQKEPELVLENLLFLAKDWADEGEMRVRETIMADLRPIDDAPGFARGSGQMGTPAEDRSRHTNSPERVSLPLRIDE